MIAHYKSLKGDTFFENLTKVRIVAAFAQPIYAVVVLIMLSRAAKECLQWSAGGAAINFFNSITTYYLTERTISVEDLNIL